MKSHGARPVFEVPRHLLVNLSETQRTIIKQLIKRQTVKVPELAIELSVSPQAIRKAITPLVEAGLVIQEGKARGTTYSLKESLLG
jgi:DeoR/GlpR family transcriptional regulator of sugar metabolism